MTSASVLRNQFTANLNDAVKKLDLRKFSLNLNLNILKGDGFQGEFYKVSITDDESTRTYDFVVKKALTEKIRREVSGIDCLYKNEIFFYSEICPAFKKFEAEHHISKSFGSIPAYIISGKQQV
jgi:hypothetical protein